MQKIIEFADKVALNENPSIPDINKVKDTDINEIKAVVNGSLQGTNAMGSIVVDDVNCKNMLSPSNIRTGIYKIGDGTYSESTTACCTLNKIEIDNTKNYVLSTTNTQTTSYMYIMYYDASGTYLGYINTPFSSGSLLLNSYSNYSNAKYVNFRFDVQLANLNNAQLEIGSTATEYTEYKQPVKQKSYGVKESCTFYADDFKCKNLFDRSTIEIGRAWNWQTGFSNRATGYIKVQPNKTYTFSTSSLPSGISVSLTGKNELADGTALINISNNTFTTPTNCYYIMVQLVKSSGNISKSDYENVTMQLEIGSEATSYTPYKNFDNTLMISPLLSDTTLTASTSYALSDAITNYKYIMLVLTSGGSFENANRQYIPVEQIQGFSNLYRCALSVFQSTSVYMFADMYFADATHIYCNTVTRGTTGWAGHLKVYGIK